MDGKTSTSQYGPDSRARQECGQDAGVGIQRDYGVLILGQFQNPIGCGPVQPAIGDPALSKRLDKTISRGALQSKFCNSRVAWNTNQIAESDLPF